MSDNGKSYRNIVLISQISISVMVPTFLCLAVGLWLDKKLGTSLSVPLLFIGMLAGARNAYVLAKSTIESEEKKRKRMQEREIQEKVERYNKEHQEKK
ncbi:MAG: AtpZ/AtpI family protein [Lachnospira sp.]